MSPLARATAVLVIAAAAVACGPLKAKSRASLPALDAPEPPTHMIIPVSIPEPEPPASPPISTATPTRPRDTTTTPVKPPDRSSPPPASPPSSTTTAPPVVETPPPPPPVLQTVSNGAEEEKKVVATLQRARTDLQKVTYASLKTEARAHYDLAQSFIKRAEEALQVKNYPFAAQLADKAANLASQLLKTQ